MACCRSCSAPLGIVMADLGELPLANALVPPERAGSERRWPLRVLVCGGCGLAQLEAAPEREELFPPGYPYRSSVSATWRAHCRAYAEAVVARYGLRAGGRAVEVASNDGILLAELAARGLRVLGVEPAAAAARDAEARGVPTRVAFFGAALGRELACDGPADLVVANNVLAHVPDPHDVVAGLAELLAPAGVLTIEVAHLLRLVCDAAWDTIYHEHVAYFSLAAARRLLSVHGLVVHDVEELPTHGGSLRLHAGHAAAGRSVAPAVDALLAREAAAGLEEEATYAAFATRVAEDREAVRAYFARAREEGRLVLGYGASAKASTLLGHCGVGPDDLPFIADAAPSKQGLVVPGTGIPVRAPGALLDARPDDVLVLPWNLRDEVVSQLAPVRAWGGRFVVRAPALTVL